MGGQGQPDFQLLESAMVPGLCALEIELTLTPLNFADSAPILDTL